MFWAFFLTDFSKVNGKIPKQPPKMLNPMTGASLATLEIHGGETEETEDKSTQQEYEGQG